jgi:hypothetical protein
MDSCVFRLIGLKPKKAAPKKLLIFTLPSKSTLREAKLTVILLSVVVCHLVAILSNSVPAE